MVYSCVFVRRGMPLEGLGLPHISKTLWRRLHYHLVVACAQGFVMHVVMLLSC